MMTFIQQMSNATGLSEAYLRKLTRKAPHSYKHYTIPKRGGGTRDIYHPSAELKAVQLWMVAQIFTKLPVHRCVYSYKAGVNVAMHAERHRSSNFLLRIDLKNFFPSITSSDVCRLLLENHNVIAHELSGEDLEGVCRLVCRAKVNSKALALTIGAPSSPSISNAILHGFDTETYEYCEKLGVTYTRYADDLYFSTNTPNLLEGVFRFVKSALGRLSYPKLEVNDQKTVFTSRKRRRVVTGITLTSDKKLSLGREAKRKLKTQVYLCLSGRLTQEEIGRLRGKLSYMKSVEPSFFQALRAKFGEKQIYELLRGECCTHLA